jgi:polyhydroxybutyrate depolymerase
MTSIRARIAAVGAVCVAVAGGAGLAGCGSSAGTQRETVAQQSATSVAPPASAVSNESGERVPHTTFRPPPIIYRPADVPLSVRAPMLVALHALGGTPSGFQTTSGWNRLADQHHFVVAYLGSPQPAWKDTANNPYVSAMIAKLIRTENIDPQRVYVTGFSAGAVMSYRAACLMNSEVTAVAPVSGGEPPTPCNVSRPVSVFAIIGTADAIPTLSDVNTTARWAAYDGCVGAPVIVNTGLLTKRTWSRCADGTSVVLWVINGGVHIYPGAPGVDPSSPDGQLDATPAIWSFFAGRVSGSPSTPSARLVSLSASGNGVDAILSTDEAVTVAARLLQGQNVAASQSFSVALGQTATLPLRLSSGASGGAYTVELRISDAYGRHETIRELVPIGR